MLGGFILLFIEKGDVVIFLSRYHNVVLDLFFSTITYLGDGAFVALVCIGFIIYNRYYGLLLVSLIVPNALLVQFLKRIVFNYPRPLKHLGEEFYVIVKYVTVHTDFSFPSGHSNAIFAMMFSLCILSKNTTFQIVVALLAVLTAVSRMYLYQHFLEDITFGALLAIVLCTILYHFIFQRTSLESKLKLPS